MAVGRDFSDCYEEVIIDSLGSFIDRSNMTNRARFDSEINGSVATVIVAIPGETRMRSSMLRFEGILYVNGEICRCCGKQIEVGDDVWYGMELVEEVFIHHECIGGRNQ